MTQDTAHAPTIPQSLSEVAAGSYSEARAAIPPIGSPNSRANLRAVAAGVVDSLVEQSARIAARLVPTAADAAAFALWDEICDALARDWLTTDIFCTRTGRLLSTVDPAPWLDYLRLVASMPATDPARVGTVARIKAAIISQKAYAIAPVVLDISGAGLALARIVDPRDYCIISLSRFFAAPAYGQSVSPGAPAPRVQPLDLARRGEILGQARELMAELPAPVLAYAAECLGLYLSNIDPLRLPAACNPLAHYKGDLLAPWRSVATVSHLCGRLVQGLIAEIAALKLRPVASLSKGDLRRLRVHFGGSHAHKSQRGDLAAYNRAIREGIKDRAADARAHKDRLTARERALLADVRADSDLSLLLDVLDLQSAISATGRSIPAELETRDAPAVLTRQAAIREARAAEADSLLGDPLALDLSGILAMGELPDEFLPAIDDEADFINAGLFTAEELAEFDFDFGGDDTPEDDDVSAHSDLLAALDLETVMAQAQPTVRPSSVTRPARRNSAIDDETARLLESAMRGELDNPPAPAPTRRPLFAPKPVAPAPALAEPVPAPRPGGAKIRTFRRPV